MALVVGIGLMPTSAFAKTEITWWHAMSGSRLKVVDKIVADFNTAHPEL